MLLEILGFFGIFFIIAFYFAEQKKPHIGIITSLFLIVFGLLVMADGIQMKTGETNIITGLDTGIEDMNGTSDLLGNTTTYYENALTNTTITRNETKTYTYADIPAIPYIDISQVFGMIISLFGMYGTLHYIGEVI